MFEIALHYAPIVLAVVGVGVLALPKLQAQSSAEPNSLAAKILADIPALKSVESNMLGLGRDASEVVALIESQIAKRIAEAKAVKS